MFIVLAESYLHDLDPFAIRLTESFGLRWYGLAYAVGFLIAWLFIRWMAKSGRSPLTKSDAADLMFYAIVGVLLGGRIGYAAFYDPHLFIGFSSTLPYWDLLAINKGGMASHGGMIGVALACFVFARRRRAPVLHLFDLAGIGCTAGFFFGRLANFVNGELKGRPLPDAMQADPPWWSIKYPDDIYTWDPQIPAEAEKLAQLEPLYRTLGGEATFLQNIVEAARRGNEQVVQILRPLLTAYYPSQILQSLTDGLLVAVLGADLAQAAQAGRPRFLVPDHLRRAADRHGVLTPAGPGRADAGRSVARPGPQRADGRARSGPAVDLRPAAGRAAARSGKNRPELGMTISGLML